VWAIIAFVVHGDWGWGFVAVAWLTMALAGSLETLIHETGHALAARLAGFQLVLVQIGRGPEALTYRRGSLRLSLRRYAMLGGKTRFIAPPDAAAWRQALAFLGGPLFSLSAAGVLIVAVLGRDRSETSVLAPMALGFAILGLISAVNTLWPATSSEGQPTDGAQLLALFRKTAAVDPRLPLLVALEQLQAAGRYAEALRRIVEQLKIWPNDPYLLSAMIHYGSRVAGDREALARYHALVAAAPADPPRPFDWHREMVGWLAANLAWVIIKSGADLERADLELQTALEHLPHAVEVKATLGALYVARGEAEIGERLLIEGMRQVEDPLDRADFCRFVATARRDRGDAAGAFEADRLREHILARASVPAT